MCKPHSCRFTALLLGLFLVSSTQSPAFALPPRVIADGELLVIERDADSDAASDEPAAEKSPADADNLSRFLPEEKLDPLLVHPNYYTRDLEFQAASIPRGRYLLVASNARTHCRCTVPLTLPDGSPVIVHRKHSITYVYPSQRVIVDFGLFGHREPKVLYRNGQGTFRTAHEKLAGATQATRDFIEQFPLAGALDERGRKTTDTAKGAFVAAGGAGKAYVDTVGKLLDGIPGVQPLRSLGERIPELSKQEGIRRAGERAARNAKEFIPTVR